ncbi:unnamed protein product [Penicillium bialowiezense]
MNSIKFEGPSSGSQIGINNGVVNNEFHSDLSAKLPMVHEATFNSFEDQHEPECHPGTRIDLIRQIEDWAQPSDAFDSKCIFWLNGMAGTGKSTISRTIARRFKNNNSLGASFFFKRGEGDRGTAKYLVTTIARQLARSIPEMLPLIEHATQEHENIATKTMEEQFDKLIIGPLLGLKPHSTPSHQTTRTRMIVIDALDECDGEIEHDLSLFLHHQLSEIGTKRSLPSDWIKDSTIQELVRLSCPLFIFAATVCRMLEDPRFDPAESLAETLGFERNISNLDKTYLPVLNRLVSSLQDSKQTQRLVEKFQQIVGAIINLESPLSIASLSQLIDVPELSIRTRLDLLHSVLNVPDDKTLPVRLFHLSFRDFLVDPETRNKTLFWIDLDKAHLNMARKCFSICQKYLRKNICEILTDATPREALDRTTINRHMPPEAQYACRYWPHHLLQCINQPDSRHTSEDAHMLDDVYSFLTTHFLHWVEAMSILGIISDVVGIIDTLLDSVANTETLAIIDFLTYGKQLVLKNAHIIDAIPLQIYCAALIFALQNAIHKTLQGDLPSWISQLPLIDTTSDSELNSFDTLSQSNIRAVAFSPNGRHLARMSDSIQVRKFPTGTLQFILKSEETSEDEPSFLQIEFSPDSKLLASLSANETQVWDPTTGAIGLDLESGISDQRFKSLSFSSNSRLLGSMSSSEIRVWDLTTGFLRLRLDIGHPESELEWFSFSPDGQIIACASIGGLLRTFDSATGVLRHAIDIDPHSPARAEFSPDSRFLVSSCNTGRLVLHNLEEGKLNQALKGDSERICSLAVSPDSKFVACGSRYGTVYVFELSAGHSKNLIRDFSTAVTVVVFSPDSRVLASVNLSTIRLWDPMSGELQYELETTTILKTIFSPDSSLFVAARIDGEITVLSCVGNKWEDAGDLSAQVDNLTFLPDSTALILACGSDGGILRLWDLAHRPDARNNSLIVRLHLCPNGQLLASRSGGEFIIWDTMTGIRKHELKQDIHRGYDLAELPVAFSHDSRLVALMCPTRSSAGVITIWNVGTGTLKKTIQLPSFFPRRLRNLERFKTFSLKFDSDDVLVFDGKTVTILWDSRIGVWTSLVPPNVLYEMETNKRWLMMRARVKHLVWKGTHALRTLSSKKKLERADEGQENDARVITSQAETNISIVSDQWIALNDERVLLLPPEFRHAVPTILVDGCMVALAHVSGNVLFLRFGRSDITNYF